MKNSYVKLVMALGTLLLIVLPVHAEIYKWVDKDGAVRYTDTPPPVGVKPISTINKKSTKPAPAAKLPDGSMTNPAFNETANGVSQQDVAKKKRELEELERKNNAEKEAQAKQRQLNCIAAKANYQNYSQGGRVYRMNEKGEREYVDEKGFAEGAAQAQRDIQEYCS